MRFIVTGEWNRNRLLQAIVVLYCLYVALLWLSNVLLYFDSMSLSTTSVVAHYLGDEAQYLSARSYRGLLEVSHFHLFAIGMLLLVLTHLALFIPVRASLKAWLVAVPFLSGLVSEAAGWLVRFAGPQFAILKIAGFLVLQGSLAALVAISLWSVFARGQGASYEGGR